MKHVQNFGTLGGRLGGKNRKVNEKIQKQLFGGVLTALKMSKYGDFFGPHFPAFSPNKGKYRPENTPYLDIFHAVQVSSLKSAHQKKVFFRILFLKINYGAPQTYTQVPCKY